MNLRDELERARRRRGLTGKAPWLHPCPECGLIVGRVIFVRPGQQAPECPKCRELRAQLPPHAPINTIRIRRQPPREELERRKADAQARSEE